MMMNNVMIYNMKMVYENGVKNVGFSVKYDDDIK